jgi:hypothetical protein
MQFYTVECFHQIGGHPRVVFSADERPIYWRKLTSGRPFGRCPFPRTAGKAGGANLLFLNLFRYFVFARS